MGINVLMMQCAVRGIVTQLHCGQPRVSTRPCRHTFCWYAAETHTCPYPKYLRFRNYLTGPTRRPVSFFVGAGPLPPTPPPRLAAALDGGLLPCLERLMRRAAKDPEGNVSKLVQDVLSSTEAGNGFDEMPDILWLVAYGEAAQSVGFLSALASLLPQPGRGGGSGGGGGGGNTSRHGSKAGPKEGEMGLLAVHALTAASGLLGSGFGLWGASAPLGGGSGDGGGGCRGSGSGGGCDGGGGSGGGSPRATCPSGLPPPGRCRLQHMLAHAAQLLLPLLARFVCCCSGGADPGPAPPGRATSTASGVQQDVATLARHMAGAITGPLLVWVQTLCVLGLDDGSGLSGSGGGSCDGGENGSNRGSNGSSGSGGNRDGCAIGDNDDAGCGAGSSGSTGGRATHIGGHALGDAGDGRALAATQEQQQQQQRQQQETSALQSVHGAVLRRFLFEEVQAVELLGTVLRHLHSLPAFTSKGPALVRALCMLALAYPQEVMHRVQKGRCSSSDSSSSSSGRGGGGARKQRGVSGGGAGYSSEHGSVWPVDLLRGLRAHAKEEDGGRVAVTETLANLLEGWRERGAGDGEGEGQWVTAAGEGLKDSEVSELLRLGVKRVEEAGYVSAGMKRVLCEVLSAPAAPLVA